MFLGQLICYFLLVLDIVSYCVMNESSVSLNYSGLDNKTKQAHFLGSVPMGQSLRPGLYLDAPGRAEVMCHVNYITKSCLGHVTLSLRYCCSGCLPL